tara:strand:- start:1044 stop:1313 length:270 start_codon:yes stop_codon:yes gene_type:complete
LLTIEIVLVIAGLAEFPTVPPPMALAFDYRLRRVVCLPVTLHSSGPLHEDYEVAPMAEEVVPMAEDYEVVPMALLVSSLFSLQDCSVGS